MIPPASVPFSGTVGPDDGLLKHGGMLRSIYITTSFWDPVLFTIEMGEPVESVYKWFIYKKNMYVLDGRVWNIILIMKRVLWIYDKSAWL